MGSGASKNRELIGERRNSQVLKNHGDNLIVAAIDFGTTFTGYAFSLRKFSQIYTGRYQTKLEEDREPSILLLKPDKSFDSFGNRAIERFLGLSKGDRKQYFYFKYFKMKLHNSKNLNQETCIADVRNREVKALEVFSHVIRYLRELAESDIKDSNASLNTTDIKWMLTVPAIWSYPARQFMTEAAKTAGIPEKNLRLILEPEAAALYCAERLMIATKKESTEKLPAGYKYVLADLGGGTVDICAHEVIEGGKLRELYRATGGDCGGNKVNTYFFEKIMIKIVGGPTMTKFKENYPQLFWEFEKDFESKKKTFDLDTSVLSLKIDTAMLEILKKETGENLEGAIAQMPSHCTENLTFKSVEQRLILRSEIIREMFKETVDGVIQKLEDAFANVEDSKALILVGGLAESPYMRKVIQEKIKSVDILLEQDAKLAVMKGAVIMGYNQRNIIERRSPFTYGFSGKRKFKHGTDPVFLKIPDSDKCEGVFEKSIEKGQILKTGEIIESTSVDLLEQTDDGNQTKRVELWKSEGLNPSYCLKKEECERVVEFNIQAPECGWSEYVRITRSLIVRDTELEIKVKDSQTNIEHKATTDFL